MPIVDGGDARLDVVEDLRYDQPGHTRADHEAGGGAPQIVAPEVDAGPFDDALDRLLRVRDAGAFFLRARKHPRRVARHGTKRLQHLERLGGQWHAVRQAVLAPRRGNRPPAARQVHLVPRRAEHFPTALRREQPQPKQRGDDHMLCLECRPHSANLVFAQHTVSLFFWRKPFDHVAGIQLDPIVLNREVEHLPDERQCAIGHNRRARRDLVEDGPNLSAGHVLDR